jgi:hypothetical protein
MPLRTKSALVCNCGHTGKLNSAENDQPYSENWVHHSVSGFSGTVTKDWALKGLICPTCQRTGEVNYADGS